MKTKQLIKKAIGTAMISAAVIFGSSVAFAQVKIGTSPTTISPSNNLEVEASTPGMKTSIDKVTGKVTIVDGTQANGRVFTSNATGTGSWQPAGLVVLTAYNPNTMQPTIGATEFMPSIPLVSGDATGYNAINGIYTVPVSGFYSFHYMMQVMGPLGELFTLFGGLPLPIEDGGIRGSSTQWNGRALSATGYFAAGTPLYVIQLRGGAFPFTSDWKVRNVSLTIIRY